jgi:murein DD-endopeptidase MepM/ murein hydrolase activator NlpD
MVVLATPVSGTLRAEERPPAFRLPVDCRMGVDCFLQNHVDHDAGPGRLDHACGRLSYDGEKGTDFRVRDLPAMRRGVDVLAAADGVVVGARDGEPDLSVRIRGRAAVSGREAGNGVVLDHGGGWHTQYSHLMRGSVAVRPGDRVRAGDRLGRIGLSGLTEFPHLDFAVRKDDRTVDPFVGPGRWSGCDGARRPLWAPDALTALAYRPTGVLIAGFAAGSPDAEQAREGAYAAPVPATGAALVFWADLFGAQQGDRQTIRVTGPDGSAVVDDARTLEASNVSWFTFAGRRTPPGGWSAGTYTGTIRLDRGGATVAEATATIRIDPDRR